MKYFTKEELEDITKELIENPTRDTLKKLNEKYNGVNEIITNENSEIVEPKVEELSFLENASQPMILNGSTNGIIEEIKPNNETMILPPAEPSNVNSISNFDIPNANMSQQENNVLNITNYAVPEIPTIDLPKLDTLNIIPNNNIYDNSDEPP